MRVSRNRWGGRLAGLAVVLPALGLMGSVVRGDVTENAKLLPADTFAYVVVESVDGLWEKFKRTSLYGLYKDPAMQPFVAEAETQIREKTKEGLKELWKELGLSEPPSELPIPSGEVLVGVFVALREIEVPDFAQWPEDAGEDFDVESLPTIKQKVPDFQMVLTAEMGDKADATAKLLREATSKAAEAGLVRGRETVRGVEITLLKKDAQADANYDTLCYGFQGQRLIAASSLRRISDLLGRRGDGESLADDQNFRRAVRKLGDGDVFVYLNAAPLWESMKAAEASSNGGEGFMTQAMAALGLDAITGVGYALQVATNPGEDGRGKFLIGMQGERRGIGALLTPTNTRIRPNRLLTKDLANFMVSNYDLGKVYAQAMTMATALSPINPEVMLQSTMGMTGEPGEGGLPPVNLREEVFGQLAGPIINGSRLQKPYTSGASVQTFFAAGVRDGKVLENALRRIHRTFLAQGNKELQRELRNVNLFVLPGTEMLKGLIGGGEDEETKPMAFAVVGDQLVIGGTDVVEQSIRDLGREDLEGIEANAMYQHVSHYLPERAGVITFDNTQETTEQTWVMFKDAAREAAAGSAGSAINPLTLFVEEFLDDFDLTTLPDYDRVRKYFGAALGFVVDGDEGIYAEGIGIHSPEYMKDQE